MQLLPWAGRVCKLRSINQLITFVKKMVRRTSYWAKRQHAQHCHGASSGKAAFSWTRKGTDPTASEHFWCCWLIRWHLMFLIPGFSKSSGQRILNPWLSDYLCFSDLTSACNFAVLTLHRSSKFFTSHPYDLATLETWEKVMCMHQN